MKKILLILFLVTSIISGCEKEEEDEKIPYINLLGVKQNSGDPAVYADLSYGNVPCATSAESGVAWATTNNPTTSSNKVIFVTQCYSNSGGNVKITGIPSKTKVYLRGYSLTSGSAGVLYSPELSITTN